MNFYAKKRILAVKLRKKGLSYNEIRKRIGVAKSTLSIWLKTIPLKPGHRDRLYTKQIASLSFGTQSQKERRNREIEIIISNAQKEIALPISNETLRLFGAALYWAEGSKGSRFEITNSDPSLIFFITEWLHKIFGIEPSFLKAQLNIYPQQDEKTIKKFWSGLCGIPLLNFGKSYIKPISTGYKSNNLSYGTIKIIVPRGTDMRHRVFGWIKKVLSATEPKIS
jgi:transcriptional regulator with XRE-family HTH domain